MTHKGWCVVKNQTNKQTILTLACKGLLISERCHVRFATLVDKKRGVRDDIKYTWTSLKIVRLGIARTHGWVELVPTVHTSSTHRSSTVTVKITFKIWFYLCFGKTTQMLLTRGCNLEAIIFENSQFCQPLFEGNFTIRPEWVTNPKLQ